MMTRSRCAWLIATLAVLTASGCALSRNSSERAELGVLSADDARIQARTGGDIESLGRIYAADYVLITAEGSIRNRQDQLGEMTSGKLQFRPVKTLERTVGLYHDTAIVFSRESSIIMRNGQDIGGDFRVSRVYVWRDERWQLVVTQATRVAPP